MTDSTARDIFVKAVHDYAADGANNAPLSDWYETTNGQSQGFRARPVVGGHLALVSRLFLKSPPPKLPPFSTSPLMHSSSRISYAHGTTAYLPFSATPTACCVSQRSFTNFQRQFVTFLGILLSLFVQIVHTLANGNDVHTCIQSACFVRKYVSSADAVPAKRNNTLASGQSSTQSSLPPLDTATTKAHSGASPRLADPTCE